MTLFSALRKNLLWVLPGLVLIALGFFLSSMPVAEANMSWGNPTGTPPPKTIVAETSLGNAVTTEFGTVNSIVQVDVYNVPVPNSSTVASLVRVSDTAYLLIKHNNGSTTDVYALEALLDQTALDALASTTDNIRFEGASLQLEIDTVGVYEIALGYKINGGSTILNMSWGNPTATPRPKYEPSSQITLPWGGSLAAQGEDTGGEGEGGGVGGPP
jgi:hypothetical protein